ncbi:MAG: class I SAM-dependent methyltransferase [Nocardioidaceae bacterium]
MTALGTRLAEKGFGRPSGLLGRLGGRLMARGNAATEQHMVTLADLQQEEVVLVMGPGPGIGLQAAAQCSAHVIGIDPSEVMLDGCRRRCADAIGRGRTQLIQATAEHTGQPDCSVDVVIAVNNVSMWSDRQAGCTELHRALRPGGRLLVSMHQKWLPGGLNALADTVAASGFTDVHTWTWAPPGRGATTAAQLHARRAPS